MGKKNVNNVWEPGLSKYMTTRALNSAVGLGSFGGSSKPSDATIALSTAKQAESIANKRALKGAYGKDFGSNARSGKK